MFAYDSEGVKMFRIVTVLLLVLMGLGLVPVDAGASVARSRACQEDVALIGAGEYAYTDWEITMLTGCAYTLNGKWVWPVDVEENLFQPMPVEGNRADVLRVLSRQTEELWALLDRTPYPAGGVATWGEFFRWVDADQRSALGLGAGEAAEEWGIYGFARYEYKELLRGWLQEINAYDLMLFVSWWAQARADVVPLEVAAIINGQQRASVGESLDAVEYVEDMGFWRWPWPWEMEAVYMQAWFAYRQFPTG